VSALPTEELLEKIMLAKTKFSINRTTEKQHIPDLVQAFSQENGGF
jgi:hypothetical protein